MAVGEDGTEFRADDGEGLTQDQLEEGMKDAEENWPCARLSVESIVNYHNVWADRFDNDTQDLF